MAAFVRVVAFVLITSMILVHSIRALTCASTTVRNVSNESCVYVKDKISETYQISPLQRVQMVAACAKLNEENTTWELPILDSESKWMKMRKAINATISFEKDWFFWMLLARDAPENESEARDPHRWRNDSKWRWGENGRALNKTLFPNETIPWIRKEKGFNLFDDKPDNDDIYRNDSKPENLKRFAVAGRSQTIAPNFSWFWLGARANLVKPGWLADRVLNASLLVCEGKQSATIPEIVDDTTEGDDGTLPVQWIVLAVCITVGLVASLVIAGVCYIERRHRRTSRTNTIATREEQKQREDDSSRSRDDSLSKASDSISSFLNDVHPRGHSEARRQKRVRGHKKPKVKLLERAKRKGRNDAIFCGFLELLWCEMLFSVYAILVSVGNAMFCRNREEKLSYTERRRIE